jgi:uncharacterized protein
MPNLARLIVKRSFAWATVMVVLALAVTSLFMARRISQNDDVFAFLPRSNPDVGVFYDVNKRFGGLDAAIVGVATDDVFAPDFLTRLQRVSKRLNETEGIEHALTLTSVEDVTPDPEKGGISADYLVRAIPTTPEEQAALREKVMSRDQVVGSLVSADGKATLIYCFAGHGADPKAMAGTIRALVEEAFPTEAKYWAGAPFISTYIYEVAQSDLRKLAPWACIAIILIILASFRDVVGTGLAVLSTAIGILLSLGLMGALGIQTNIILSSMPVILFALGSAYPVHLLSRYYSLSHEYDRETALGRTLSEIGPPVVASGLATVVSLLSLVFMDMAPMRTFGLFTAIGVLLTLILSVTFVPAVILLAKLKGKAPRQEGGTRARLMVWLCTFAQVRRVPVGVALAIAAVAGAMMIGRVESRTDNAAFFSKGSPPDLAETFLKERFGGSQFLQIQVNADLTDPHVLREVQGIADRIVLLPNVTSVNQIGAVVAQTNAAFEGDHRIPDTHAKAKLLFGLMTGKPALRQLVTDDRKHGLMHIKFKADGPAEVGALLEKIENLAQTYPVKGFVLAEAKGPRQAEAAARARALVLDRVTAVAQRFAVPLPDVQSLSSSLQSKGGPYADPQAVEAAILAFLRSEESAVELPETPADSGPRAAAALRALGPSPTDDALSQAIAGAFAREATDSLVKDLAETIGKPIGEIWRREHAASEARRLASDAKLEVPPGAKGQRFLTALANALMDLEAPTVLLPAGVEPPVGEIHLQATGMPVMDRGLSKSVLTNQTKSLVFALALVMIVMIILYRSVWTGLLAVSPTIMTLLVIYGGMGALGVTLDIGTSMLASLIIGAGLDYAIHFMTGWWAPPKSPLKGAAARAAAETGPAIGTNAIMVCAGFFVLTLGDARPLQQVGGLTAAAMLAAALATFLIIPVLARKHRYGRSGSLGAVTVSDSVNDGLGASPPSGTAM